MIRLGNNITTTLPAESYSPSSVTGTLALWVNVRQGVTVQATGLLFDDVHQWDDLSGTGVSQGSDKLVRVATNSAPQLKNNVDLTDKDPISFIGETNGDALKLQKGNGSAKEIILDQSDNGYTICFIATNEALDSESTLFGSFSNDNAGIAWVDGDKIRLSVESEAYEFDATSLNDDQFYSFMFVVQDGTSANNAKLYVNNAETDAKTIQEDFVFGMVGGNNGVPKNSTTNRIKQIILYNTAISDSDRNALYTNYISPAITN